ncbi:MAG: class II glutamine amidotransferase, partial [Clostridia bacterium]|nr:class II glutamine amidotransferase [Deltaproteobacteria bacterium]
MPNLFAMSFEGALAPSIDLKCLSPGPGQKLPDGWGIGFYPGGEPSAAVLKEARPPEGSMRGELVRQWENLEAACFVVHVRSATWGSITDANTQPFSRSYGRRDWLFAHSGSLSAPLATPNDAIFEPVGSSDTEAVFCALLGELQRHGWKSLADCDPVVLRDWFASINGQGDLTVVLTDGSDLAVYADIVGGASGVHVIEVLPPYAELAFADSDLCVDITKREVKSRKGIVIATNPLEALPPVASEWRKLDPGSLLIVREGAIRSETKAIAPAQRPERRRAIRPPKVLPKTMRVTHHTTYTYKNPVERSIHTLRLTPMHDRLQQVLENRLSVSVDGQSRDYEDVHGNRVRRLLLETPFTELRIESESIVRLLDTDPLDFRSIGPRSTIPLVWMPWHRQILAPFLLPQELPESELQELVEYAMSFVSRNNYDLIDTLLDMNASIFREYKYVQGATNLTTTPFEVYVDRQGVCQDFANLYICLARLLGVPARYVCGYIYTGPKNANQVQSEASHAWLQVYLPEVGWKGFDPT